MALVVDQPALPLALEAIEQPRSLDRRAPSSALRRQLDHWGATPIFDEYWRFAVERQRMLVRRLAGAHGPWTADPVLAAHRFTNPYRFSDRVSQYLLREVQYNRPWDAESLVLRTLLFKIFNRIDTWDLIRRFHGEVSRDRFDVGLLLQLLENARLRGQRIYSAAYIIPNPAFGARRKHVNHLRLLEAMRSTGTIASLAKAPDLRALYELLIATPSFGPFLAFQFAVDLNYSSITATDESGFVVAGPGARDGIRKCFTNVTRGGEEELILWVTDTQKEHFERLGLDFPYLFDRNLRPIDCQNLFCEIDKYARVRFPTARGNSGRTRIKQGYNYISAAPLPDIVAPPKWLAAT